MNENNQQKLLEFQLLKQQFNELQQQLNIIEQQLNELKLLEDNLSNLKKVKPGTEIFSSLSPGVFIKSELKDNKEVLMNIGASVVVKKSIPSARILISKKVEEINEIIKQLEEQIHITSTELHKIQEELEGER